MGFSWNCPHCNRAATIGSNDRSEGKHIVSQKTKLGEVILKSHISVCPNQDCKQPTIKAALYNYDSTYQGIQLGEKLHEWMLLPDSEAKIFPEYIPRPISEDYYEACKIKYLSPKASATLARRCLQGMIRDFWKVSKDTLAQEIRGIKDLVDPVTWDAIDSVRRVGNIGAHMEKDINTIIEVEPEEATILLQLIEDLIEDWYTASFKRAERKKRMIELALEKDAAKKPVRTEET